jgi:ketosteroid isomerase-like protein
MRHYTQTALIKIVTDSFEAERTNDVTLGKSLITSDFKQRGMIISGDKIFPVFAGGDIPVRLEDAYALDGREFHVWNAAANEETQTVFIELAEVEPTKDSRRVWPYVLVCQIEDGRIKRSRHYGDPATLQQDISVEQVRSAVQD